LKLNEIVIYLMTFFMLLGAVDTILGNKFGIGEKFKEGIMTMGSLVLAMVGLLSLTPVLAAKLSPLITPVYTFLGADPSLFAATFISCDMGGYSFARQIAASPQAVGFCGLIISSMMGCTLSFTLPAGLGIIAKKDEKYFAMGVLSGVTTIPLGCAIGGIAAGYSFHLIIFNLLPIMVFSSFLIVGLIRFPHKLLKAFSHFSKFILSLSIIGLAAAIVENLVHITLIPGLAPLDESIKLVGTIAVILSGSYPMVFVLQKLLRKPLAYLGGLLGIEDFAAAGFLASLASNLPMFNMLKQMDNRGKILNCAFGVSGAFIFGGQFAFIMSVDSTLLMPVILAKLTAGISAVVVAVLILRPRYSYKEEPLVEKLSA